MKLSFATVLAQAVAMCFAVTDLVVVKMIRLEFDPSRTKLWACQFKLNDYDCGARVPDNLKHSTQPCYGSDYEFMFDYTIQGGKYTVTIVVTNPKHHVTGKHTYPDTILCKDDGVAFVCLWDAGQKILLAKP